MARFRTTPIALTVDTAVDPAVDASGRLITTSVDASGNSIDTGPRTMVATAAVASNQVAKAAPGVLYGLNVAVGASAGYVMLFDAVAFPANGAVTPKKVFQVAANSFVDLKWERGLKFTTGIVVGFSTTGPYTLTASATAFIETETV